MAVKPTRVYASRLAGTAVFDPNGDKVGKVRDVVVMLRADRNAPRVHGLVLEVPPRRRIFLPMTRVTGTDSGQIVATGAVNLRRFEPRPGETLVVAELLDRKVTLRADNQEVTILDLAVEQSRHQRDWTVSKVFVRVGGGSGGFRRRGETRTLNWDEVVDLSVDTKDQGVEAILRELDDMRAADVASLLRSLPSKRRLEVMKALDDERLADVMEELPEPDQVAMIAMLEDKRVADVLEEMDPGDAADLLNELPPERAEILLALVEPDDAEDLRRLLIYDDKSAGGLMTTEPIILAPDATVAEALARMRNPELPPALAAQVFVARHPLETPTGKFLGLVHFQRLLREVPSTLVSAITDADVEIVHPDATLDEVVRCFATYNLVGLPVIDDSDHLVGVVTVDDVIDHMLPQDWRERGSDDAGTVALGVSHGD